ncbi:MAG TPA: ABC transporter permease, partial [Phototrophicaceae bacterium]|nr:ABC transporter permease [Phototrophicaceae bacterium]
MTRESARRKTFNRRLYILRRNPLVVVGMIVLMFWLLVVLTGPTLAPADPLKQAVSDRLTAPGDAYSLGTDELGRDILSRVLYGARLTIPAGIAVVLIGSIIGLVVGAVSGYVGGVWDELMMRLTELFMAFPTIILALAITAALGPDIRNAIIALVVVWWPGYARLVR